MRRDGTVLALAALLLAAGGFARADGAALCHAGSARLTAARAAVAAARDSLPARFELADALVEANCYHDAVHTLEDGKSIHPHSAELTAKLRTTRSLVSEQDYFEGKEQAELAAKLSRNRLRCTRLSDADACDEALKLKPDDVELLLGKGDALLGLARPGEADAVYRRARQLAPEDARVAAQLAAARTQRQPLLEQCEKGRDETALAACESALSKGADDERRILARIATLRRPALTVAPPLSPRVAQTPASRQADAIAAPLVAAVRTYSNAAEPSRSR